MSTPREIFVLLYRELLKQKLQTKNYLVIENNSTFLFLKLLLTLKQQPGSLFCLQLVISDLRCDTIAIQIMYLRYSRIIIVVTIFK